MFDKALIRYYIIDRLNIDENVAYMLVTQSISMIRKYLNYDISDDEIVENYPMAIILVSTELNSYMNYTEKGSIQSMTQGSRSITYNTSGLDSYQFSSKVKSILPNPRMRLL